MIKVSGLTKMINGRTIINNLSFTLQKGETLCISAPSGAGKSTLIRILAGLDRQFQGDVVINTRQRAVVFQEPSLFWYKSVEENVKYPLKLTPMKWSRTVKADAVADSYDQWMHVTGLGDFSRCYPHEISGGMKQKTAIARAFLIRPELLLLDEPFNAIDRAGKREIMEFIRRHYPEISLVWVTHHLDDMLFFANRVLTFNGMLSDDQRREETQWNIRSEKA